eukprot:2001201-Rhodomonas_salina.5
MLIECGVLCASWFSAVPRKGILQVYYCRTKEVQLGVLERGSYDSAGGVFNVSDKNMSRFCQSYLLPYCTDEAAEQHGYQPPLVLGNIK